VWLAKTTPPRATIRLEPEMKYFAILILATLALLAVGQTVHADTMPRGFSLTMPRG
jgi:hypothetical protein